MSVLSFFIDMEFCYLAAIDWCSGGVVKVLGLSPKERVQTPKLAILVMHPTPHNLGMPVAMIGAKKGHFSFMEEKKAKQSVHTGKGGIYRE